MNTLIWILFAVILIAAVIIMWLLGGLGDKKSLAQENERLEIQLAKSRARECVMGKTMQFSYNTFPSYWKVVEENPDSGELKLECTNSPFSFKTGNASVGAKKIINREDFREYVV